MEFYSQIEDIAVLLKSIMQLIENRVEVADENNTFIDEAVSLYAKLACVLTSAYKRDESNKGKECYDKFLEDIVELLSWTERYARFRDEFNS